MNQDRSGDKDLTDKAWPFPTKPQGPTLVQRLRAIYLCTENAVDGETLKEAIEALSTPRTAATSSEVEVPLALPADEKKRIGRAIADEMAKNWQSDEDVIDSFGRVAAIAYVLGMRPREASSAEL